jgi:benzoylformate decarboxylase
MALTPPYGPVFVNLPMDVLDQSNDEEMYPSSVPETRSSPADKIVQKIADVLLDATRPMILIGDGIACSEAQPELDYVARLLGAEIWGTNTSEVNCDGSG